MDCQLFGCVGSSHSSYCSRFTPCDRPRYDRDGKCRCGGTRERHAEHRARLRREAAEAATRPAPKTITVYVLTCTAGADYWGKEPDRQEFYDESEALEQVERIDALGACPGSHPIEITQRIVA